MNIVHAGDQCPMCEKGTVVFVEAYEKWTVRVKGKKPLTLDDIVLYRCPACGTGFYEHEPVMH